MGTRRWQTLSPNDGLDRRVVTFFSEAGASVRDVLFIQSQGEPYPPFLIESHVVLTEHDERVHV